MKQYAPIRLFYQNLIDIRLPWLIGFNFWFFSNKNNICERNE